MKRLMFPLSLMKLDYERVIKGVTFVRLVLPWQ